MQFLHDQILSPGNTSYLVFFLPQQILRPRNLLQKCANLHTRKRHKLTLPYTCLKMFTQLAVTVVTNMNCDCKYLLILELEAVLDIFGREIAFLFGWKDIFLQLIVFSPTLERIYRTHALNKHDFRHFLPQNLRGWKSFSPYKGAPLKGLLSGVV